MAAPLLEVIASVLGAAVAGISAIGAAKDAGKSVENFAKEQQNKSQNSQNQQKKN